MRRVKRVSPQIVKIITAESGDIPNSFKSKTSLSCRDQAAAIWWGKAGERRQVDVVHGKKLPGMAEDLPLISERFMAISQSLQKTPCLASPSRRGEKTVPDREKVRNTFPLPVGEG